MSRSICRGVLVALVLSACVSVAFGVRDRTRAHMNSWPPKPFSCPCSNVSLCKPLEIAFPRDREVFAFQVDSNASGWSTYDWDVLTTVALFGGFDQDILCQAHENEVRLVLPSVNTSMVVENPSLIPKWVAQTVSDVEEYFLDGVNIDYEDPVWNNQTLRDGLTLAVKELSIALKEANPNYQLSIDVGSTTNCPDGRCYDYSALANYTDIVFLMMYDERSQVYVSDPAECVAGANSAVPNALEAIFDWTVDLGVPAEKLVFGVPWYGYDYPCINVQNTSVCQIEEVPFRGVNCSDAAGTQVGIGILWENSTNATSIMWDEASMTPYYTYIAADGQQHQVWLDNAESLVLKYKIAKANGLNGVGMWNVDYQNQMNTTLRASMWAAIAKYYG